MYSPAGRRKHRQVTSCCTAACSSCITITFTSPCVCIRLTAVVKQNDSSVSLFSLTSCSREPFSEFCSSWRLFSQLMGFLTWSCWHRLQRALPQKQRWLPCQMFVCLTVTDSVTKFYRCAAEIWKSKTVVVWSLYPLSTNNPKDVNSTCSTLNILLMESQNKSFCEVFLRSLFNVH